MAVDNTPSQTRKFSNFDLGLAVLVPSAFSFYLAVNAGALPGNDYWGIIEKVFSVDGFSQHLENWLVSQNGHIVFIPRIIYAANIILTSGSNIGLTLTTWLFALLQTILLILLLPDSIQNRAVKFAMIFGISAFSFTPSAAHSWILGYSGVHWIAANLLAIASITCLVHYLNRGQLWWLGGSLLAAFAAIFTYGTSLGLWLALSSGTVLIGRRLKPGFLLTGLTIIIITRYISTYGIQSKQAIPLIDRVYPLTHYTVTYLGAIFATDDTAAAWLGVVGLLLAIGIMGYSILRPPRMELFPWLLIIIYIAGNAFVTGLNRSHLGTDQAMMSRYASLPALFWLSIIITGLYYWSRFVPYRAPVAYYPVFMVMAGLIIAMYPVGITHAKMLLRRISLQPVTMLSVTMEIPDELVFPFSITPVPSQFLNLIPALKKFKQIPFKTAPDQTCGDIGQIIPQDLLNPVSPEKLSGYFDFMDSFTQNGARVIGWANQDARSIRCIVLLNNENTIRGLAMPGFYRPDVKSDLTHQNVGWVGYARTTSADEILMAYVLLGNNPYWLALNNTHSPQSPGPIDRSIYTNLYPK